MVQNKKTLLPTPQILLAGRSLRNYSDANKCYHSWKGRMISRMESRAMKNFFQVLGLIETLPIFFPSRFQNCYGPTTSLQPQFSPLLNKNICNNYPLPVSLLHVDCMGEQITFMRGFIDLQIERSSTWGVVLKELNLRHLTSPHLDLIQIMAFWILSWGYNGARLLWAWEGGDVFYRLEGQE